MYRSHNSNNLNVFYVALIHTITSSGDDQRTVCKRLIRSSGMVQEVGEALMLKVG